MEMAKPIEYVVELSEEEAKGFLADFFNPKPNPARDATIERAKKLNLSFAKNQKPKFKKKNQN